MIIEEKKCDMCKEKIDAHSQYVLMAITQNIIFGALYFHLDCFKNIAGDEYLNKLNEKNRLEAESNYYAVGAGGSGGSGRVTYTAWNNPPTSYTFTKKK